MTFAGAQANALDPALVRYLLAHQGKARFLVATTTSAYASLFMLDTSQPAMALGGYQGWDRILTPAQLAHLVSSGVVRYFYLPAFGGFSAAPQPGAPATASGSTDQTGDLTQWVRTTCAAVPSAQWQSSSTSNAAPFGQRRGGAVNSMQLYACKG